MEQHRVCKHNHIFGDFILVLVKKHFGSMGCPTFSHLATKNDIFNTIPKYYQSEVSVIGGVHQEVDYDMKSLIFVEPKDHVERLHL